MSTTTRLITYEELSAYVDSVCARVREKCAEMNEPVSNVTLVALPRGGLTLAHAIAWQLGQPLYYWSYQSRIMDVTTCTDREINPEHKAPTVFIDELIAKGNTITSVNAFLRDMRHTAVYCALVVDPIGAPAVNECHHISEIWCHTNTDQWCIMPWERESGITPNSRGLFRNGESTAAAANALTDPLTRGNSPT